MGGVRSVVTVSKAGRQAASREQSHEKKSEGIVRLVLGEHQQCSMPHCVDGKSSKQLVRCW